MSIRVKQQPQKILIESFQKWLLIKQSNFTNIGKKILSLLRIIPASKCHAFKFDVTSYQEEGDESLLHFHLYKTVFDNKFIRNLMKDFARLHKYTFFHHLSRCQGLFKFPRALEI